MELDTTNNSTSTSSNGASNGISSTTSSNGMTATSNGHCLGATTPNPFIYRLKSTMFDRIMVSILYNT